MFYLADDDLETHWDNGLILADGIEILEIDEEDINQQLCAIYELTYKYDQIDLHEWSGTGTKIQALAICEAGIRDVASRLAEMLDEVFTGWLAAHAITDPKKWGQARAKQMAEAFDGVEVNLLEEAIDEFAQHSQFIKSGKPGVYPEQGRYWRNVFFRELPDHVDEIAVLKRVAKPYLKDLYDMQMEDYQNGDLDEKPEKPGIDEFFDLVSEDFSGFANNLTPKDLGDLLAEIYTVMVFPVWYGRWKSEGIDATRRRVEKSYEQIKRIRKSNKAFEVRALASEVNKIIQTAHQTGSMTDYVEQRWNLDVSLLDYLSDHLDTAMLDRTLSAMGVDLDAEDRSAIARRRQRDDAAKIVRSAWEDLAEEQSGRRNPRTTLQQAVIERLS